MSESVTNVTPTGPPWRVVKRDFGFWAVHTVAEQPSWIIAENMSEANAEFVARACNAHEGLLQVVQHLATVLDYLEGDGIGWLEELLGGEPRAVLSAVIARATGAAIGGQPPPPSS